jgi:molecular chaperone GrpE (heat shock protein)
MSNKAALKQFEEARKKIARKMKDFQEDMEKYKQAEAEYNSLKQLLEYLRPIIHGKDAMHLTPPPRESETEKQIKRDINAIVKKMMGLLDNMERDSEQVDKAREEAKKAAEEAGLMQ